MSKPSHAARTLLSLDLSENEAVLYALMLEHPRSTVQQLSSRAPFPRTMLYYLLKRLEERGLVSPSRRGAKTVFVAEDPERLYDLLADKEREREKEASAVRELIPELRSRYRLAGKRPVVRTFEGVEEYRKALEGLLAAKPKEVLAFEAIGTSHPAKETREAHERARIARKIQKKVLFFDSPSAQKALRARGYDDYTLFREVMQGAAEPFTADVLYYDGRVLYTSAADAHEPVAVLIEDPALYAMQQSLFRSLWKTGTDRTLAYTGRV